MNEEIENRIPDLMNSHFSANDLFLNEEQNLLREFEQIKDEEIEPYTARIFPLTKTGEPKIENEVRLAAATENRSVLQIPKALFYVSPNNDFALRIIQKTNKTTFGYLIAEEENNNALLFCNELQKYYLGNDEGEFALGEIEYALLQNLSFQFIVPVDEACCKFVSDAQLFFPKAQKIFVERTDKLPGEKVLYLRSSVPLTLAVLKTEIHREKFLIQNGQLRLPEILLSGQVTLYFY